MRVENLLACLGVIADALDNLINVDDDEILRLYQQSIAIIRRLVGLSPNVGAAEIRLGAAYGNRANRADDGNDRISNLELARTHFNEAARIYRVFGHTDTADTVLRNVARAEEEIRQIKIDRAAVTATKGWVNIYCSFRCLFFQKLFDHFKITVVFTKILSQHNHHHNTRLKYNHR